MPKFEINSAYKPVADQPAPWRGSLEGIDGGDRFQTLLGVTGSGKTSRWRTYRAGPAADARDRAQQDAGGAALQRVPGVLPGERGRVLRLVLRLLPARGVRPGARTLYIEKDSSINEEIDRLRHSADERAVRAARRDRRGVGVLHLRPRRRREVRRPGARCSRWARWSTATRSSRKLVDMHVQAQRPGARARHVPRARRHARDLPGVRRDRLPRRVLRRRDRGDPALRPADRRGPRRARARRHLPGDALRHRPPDDRARDRRDPRRAGGALQGARGAGQAARGAAARASAPSSTWR